jgi:AcrR family transcriptional regulator
MYHQAMRATTSGKPRRTQASRQALTRTALLDATIECLLDEGYQSATTRRISDRAGVSPGALQHHFASKAVLLSEAVRHLRAKFAAEMMALGPPDAPTVEERSAQLLDKMWELHKGPLFRAQLALLEAARSDPTLSAALLDVQHETASLNAAAIPVLFPEVLDVHEFAALIDTGQAAIRGLALLAFLDPGEAERAWPITREHLIQLSHDLLRPKR